MTFFKKFTMPFLPLMNSANDNSGSNGNSGSGVPATVHSEYRTAYKKESNELLSMIHEPIASEPLASEPIASEPLASEPLALTVPVDPVLRMASPPPTTSPTETEREESINEQEQEFEDAPFRYDVWSDTEMLNLLREEEFVVSGEGDHACISIVCLD